MEKCKNCNWTGTELTKRSKLKSGVTQPEGCCPTCGESIKENKEKIIDEIAPKPRPALKR